MRADPKPAPLTEEQFARQVIDLATLNGWLVFRVENSTREITRRSGARVRVRNVNIGGVGYPDLTMVRDGRLIFAELKRDLGAKGGESRQTTTPEQDAWLGELRAVSYGPASKVDVYVWRPADMASIVRSLQVPS